MPRPSLVGKILWSINVVFSIWCAYVITDIVLLIVSHINGFMFPGVSVLHPVPLMTLPTANEVDIL